MLQCYGSPVECKCSRENRKKMFANFVFAIVIVGQMTMSTAMLMISAIIRRKKNVRLHFWAERKQKRERAHEQARRKMNKTLGYTYDFSPVQSEIFHMNFSAFFLSLPLPLSLSFAFDAISLV